MAEKYVTAKYGEMYQLMPFSIRLDLIKAVEGMRFLSRILLDGITIKLRCILKSFQKVHEADCISKYSDRHLIEFRKSYPKIMTVTWLNSLDNQRI